MIKIMVISKKIKLIIYDLFKLWNYTFSLIYRIFYKHINHYLIFIKWNIFNCIII